MKISEYVAKYGNRFYIGGRNLSVEDNINGFKIGDVVFDTASDSANLYCRIVCFQDTHVLWGVWVNSLEKALKQDHNVNIASTMLDASLQWLSIDCVRLLKSTKKERDINMAEINEVVEKHFNNNVTNAKIVQKHLGNYMDNPVIDVLIGLIPKATVSLLKRAGDMEQEQLKKERLICYPCFMLR